MPTPEDAKPDASSASANANAAGWSSTRASPAYTPSSVSVSGTSEPKNRVAAMTSIDGVDEPREPHAEHDVELLAAQQEAPLLGVRGGMRRFVSAECR